MGEVVCTKLSLEAVGSATFGSCHDASVGDQDVETLILGQERVRTLADTCQGVEVEFQEVSPAAMEDVTQCLLSLSKIPDSKIQGGTSLEKSLSSFDAKSRGTSSNQDFLSVPFSFELFMLNNLMSCGSLVAWSSWSAVGRSVRSDHGNG